MHKWNCYCSVVFNQTYNHVKYMYIFSKKCILFLIQKINIFNKSKIIFNYTLFKFIKVLFLLFKASVKSSGFSVTWKSLIGGGRQRGQWWLSDLGPYNMTHIRSNNVPLECICPMVWRWHKIHLISYNKNYWWKPLIIII